MVLYFLNAISITFVSLSRVLVGLPSAENREMILKTLLAKEKHENLDFREMATMTEGYTGSDLKVSFGSDYCFGFPFG